MPSNYSTWKLPHLSRALLAGLSLVSLLVPPQVSHATENSANHIALQAVSLHFKKANQRQGIHPAIGYEYSPNHAFGWQAGFFKDSFGTRSAYVGINYSMPIIRIGRIPGRLILESNIVHKQFTKDSTAETHFVPMPVVELGLTKTVQVNITGSPQLDYYNGKHTNGVLVFQLKLDLN